MHIYRQWVEWLHVIGGCALGEPDVFNSIALRRAAED